MRGQKFGTLFFVLQFANHRHLRPERTAVADVKARLRSHLQTDCVGLGFDLSRVRQMQHQIDDFVEEPMRYGGNAVGRHNRPDCGEQHDHGQVDEVGVGDVLGAVVEDGVGDFVRENAAEFVVRLAKVNHAGKHEHLAVRQNERVLLGRVDDGYGPVFREHLRQIAIAFEEAFGDSFDAANARMVRGKEVRLQLFQLELMLEFGDFRHLLVVERDKAKSARDGRPLQMADVVERDSSASCPESCGDLHSILAHPLAKVLPLIRRQRGPPSAKTPSRDYGNEFRHLLRHNHDDRMKVAATLDSNIIHSL